MGEFFKGWRRKSGLVMLALACVLVIGWMRSQSTVDCVIVRVGRGMIYNFRSDQFGLRFVGSNYPPNPSFFSTQWTARSLDRLPKRSSPLDENSPSYEWSMCGVHFGSDQTQLSKMRFVVCVVPYLSLILPLTLLSAWLILIKPRKAIPASGSTS